MSTKTQVGSIDLAPIKSAHDAASQVATNYVTETGGGVGIRVHPEGDTHNYVSITDDIDIVRDDVVVASFGEEAVVGATGGNNVLISSNGIALRNALNELATFDTYRMRIGTDATGKISVSTDGIDGLGAEGTDFFSINSSNASETVAVHSDWYYFDPSPTSTFSFEVPDLVNTTANQISLHYNIIHDGILVLIGYSSFQYGTPATITIPYQGMDFVIPYDGSYTFGSITSSAITDRTLGLEIIYNKNALAPFYRFGKKYGSSDPGAFSFSEGESIATGSYSHSEGRYTQATGSNSHAEGNLCRADGAGSHAEGYSCQATAQYSHAQNGFTIADSPYLTAIGQYNTPGVGGRIALVIGNGISDNNRSNALMVTWGGNVEIALDTTAATGTTDGDLYAAITALNWEGDVIS